MGRWWPSASQRAWQSCWRAGASRWPAHGSGGGGGAHSSGGGASHASGGRASGGGGASHAFSGGSHTSSGNRSANFAREAWISHARSAGTTLAAATMAAQAVHRAAVAPQILRTARSARISPACSAATTSATATSAREPCTGRQSFRESRPARLEFCPLPRRQFGNARAGQLRLVLTARQQFREPRQFRLS